MPVMVSTTSFEVSGFYRENMFENSSILGRQPQKGEFV